MQEGVKDIIGGVFNGIAVCSQVVAGVNYAFVCEVFAWSVKTTKYIALIEIHESLDGDIHRFVFKPIGPIPSKAPGGYSWWSFTVSDEAQSIFQKAVRWISGLRVGFVPLAYTTQTVEGGVNYTYLTEQRVAFGGRLQATTPYFISVFAPSDGTNPQLKSEELIKPEGSPHLALLTE